MDETNSLEKKTSCKKKKKNHHIDKSELYYVARKNEVLSNKEIKITVNFQKYIHLKKQVISNWNKNLQQTALWNAPKQQETCDNHTRNTAKQLTEVTE